MKPQQVLLVVTGGGPRDQEDLLSLARAAESAADPALLHLAWEVRSRLPHSSFYPLELFLENES